MVSVMLILTVDDVLGIVMIAILAFQRMNLAVMKERRSMSTVDSELA